MMARDYSQPGDPYGIAAEYTVQSPESADVNGPVWQKSGGDRDARGNRLLVPRGIPTQEECDAIKGQR